MKFRLKKVTQEELASDLKAEYSKKYARGSRPGVSEMEEIELRLDERGYVLVWSTMLEDLVAFYESESYLKSIPPGFVPYSRHELIELFGDDKPAIPLEKLRLIHEAKKSGARVVSQDEAEDEKS